MPDSAWRIRLKALLHALWQWPLALLILPVVCGALVTVMVAVELDSAPWESRIV